MARIRSIHPITSNVKPHPTLVDCGYQIVQSPEGTLLHLSTYGSDQRKSEPKVSQTLQLDRKTASQLIEIMRQTFPEI